MNQSSSDQIRTLPNAGLRRITLQARLVLIMLFISLVPLIFTAARNILQTQQALVGNAEISLISNAEQTASSVDTFIQTTLNSISIESEFLDFAAYLSLSAADRPGSAEESRSRELLGKFAS